MWRCGETGVLCWQRTQSSVQRVPWWAWGGGRWEAWGGGDHTTSYNLQPPWPLSVKCVTILHGCVNCTLLCERGFPPTPTGLFHLIKLPKLNSLTCHLPDTLSLAFKLKRKKFTIEVMWWCHNRGGDVITIVINTNIWSCIIITSFFPSTLQKLHLPPDLSGTANREQQDGCHHQASRRNAQPSDIISSPTHGAVDF